MCFIRSKTLSTQRFRPKVKNANIAVRQPVSGFVKPVPTHSNRTFRVVIDVLRREEGYGYVYNPLVYMEAENKGDSFRDFVTNALSRRAFLTSYVTCKFQIKSTRLLRNSVIE